MIEYVQMRISKGKLQYRYRLLEDGAVLTNSSVFTDQWSEWIEVPREI